MIPFVKAHACGNDFLVIEETLAQGRHAELAQKLCARNNSVGADGIEFLERRGDGTFHLRLFNADGSEAELSGNGTRCVAAWLAFSEGKNEVTLGTAGGSRPCSVWKRESEVLFWIQTEMGIPSVTQRTIDVPEVGEVIGAVVDVGNPHFVIFVDDESFSAYGLAWQELGAKICTHPAFKHGTNVEFVHVRTGTEIAFRIYERGCGPTTSSGTGTTASAVATMVLRNSSSAIIAHAEGGEQRVWWEDRSKTVLLSGPAEIVCVGEVAL